MQDESPAARLPDPEISLGDAASVRVTRRPFPSMDRRRILLVTHGSLICAAFLALGCTEDEERTDVVYRRPDPAIAILPFEAPDPGLDTWGAGLAELLALDLDGVAKLRTIAPRYVHARLEALPPSSRGPPHGPDRAFRIGSETGARYVVAGSLAPGEEGVRASFTVYDVDEARSLGSDVVVGDVSGDPHGLVDRVAAGVLARLPDREDARPAGLARVSTASRPALEAYLEAESRLREGRLREALSAYERAVDSDSTFAAAHLRIASIADWADPGRDPREAAERAVRWSRRLPPRGSGLSLAILSLARDRPDGLKALRQVVRRWPDDPAAWFVLAETLVRLGPAGTAAPEEVEPALRRATERAPAFAPAWARRVDAAIAAADSSRGAAFLDTLAAIDPGGWLARDRHLRFEVAFGDSMTRRRTLDEMTGTGASILNVALETLWHPRHLEAQREALALAAERPGDADVARIALAWNRARAGRLERSMDVLEGPGVDPTSRLALLYALRSRGLPVDDARLDRDFEAIRSADSEDPERSAVRLFFVGTWAVERERDEDLRDALARLRRAARHAFMDADSLSARISVASARGLEGFVYWKRDGDRREAVRRLEGALHDTEGRGTAALVNAQIRWWLGELHRGDDDPHQALAYYVSFWDDPFARARCGALRAGLGDTTAARIDYAAALAAWDDPDPPLGPRIEEVRTALEALPTLASGP